EHPARAGHGVVLLAAALHRLEDEAPDRLGIAARRLLHLPEARGVDVERLDVDDDLGLVSDVVARVEPLRGLRQGALRGEDTMGTERITGEALHVGCLARPKPRWTWG